MGRTRRSFVLAATCAALTPQAAWAEDAPGEAAPREIRPASEAELDRATHVPYRLGYAPLTWLLVQLVPSPELVVGDTGAHAGMRWQVTPVSYSFGVTSRPVRALVVPPMARHSGSVEAYASPEYLGGAPHGRTGWLGRAGGRVYFPLLERGETLSFSLGGSYYLASERGHDRALSGGSAEAGLYTLFGTTGLVVTYSPGLSERQVIATLNVRYF